MASRFDGRNEYNISQKVQAALHVLSSYYHSNKLIIYSV